MTKSRSDGIVRNPMAGVTEAGQTTAKALDLSDVLVADVGFDFKPVVPQTEAVAVSATGVIVNAIDTTFAVHILYGVADLQAIANAPHVYPCQVLS